MIVISGALVLVALVLLVIGVVGGDSGNLPFVYASIAVSLVSLVFLVIGILQRRGEPLPGGDAAPAPQPTEVPAPSAGEDATAVIPSQTRTEAPAAPVAAGADEELASGGTVLVVAGRPRYHVEGCRYLSGKDAEAVDVLDARDEGFTPCGVCKPDDALAAQQDDQDGQDVQDDQEPVVEDVPGAAELEDPEPEPEPAPARRPAARKAASTRTPAKKAATRTVADPLEEVAAGAGAKASTASPTRAAKTPAKKAPSKAAEAAVAPAARTSGKVVVIPERGRFHRAECRYVRGVEGAELLTKAQATKQGFDACGVCKP